jgi:hypothetical protein
MARCEVENQISTSWRARITGFVSVAALVVLSVVYGTLMLGLITMALIGFMLKWFWYRRIRRQAPIGGNDRVIDGDYQVLEESIAQRYGGTKH